MEPTLCTETTLLPCSRTEIVIGEFLPPFSYVSFVYV